MPLRYSPIEYETLPNVHSFLVLIMEMLFTGRTLCVTPRARTDAILSATAKLTFWNWSNRYDRQIACNADHTNDPIYSSIVCSIVTED